MTLWLALLGAVAAQSDKSGERIKAVTDTLRDLLTSIENEEAAEAKNFKCFQNWCDGERKSNGQATEDAELKIEDLKVSVDEFAATIERNEFAAKNGERDAAEIQDALDQAASIREEEQDKYARDRSLNQQSVGQLNDALKIVKKVQAVGFLQGQQKLQISAPGESSFVVGVFSSLLKNLVRNQDKADGIEQQKVQMYDNLHATKTQQFNLVQSDIRSKRTLRAEAKQKLVDTQNDLTTTEAALEAGRTRLEDTGKDCKVKEEEYAERTEDRQKEKAAIHEAISYLSIAFATDGEAPPPAFVQLSMLQAPSMLQALSGDLSTLSDKVGQAGRADHFEAVKKVIMQLVGVLEQEQTDEDAKKTWCEAELQKTEAAQSGKSDAVERSKASIDKSTALVAQLLQAADSLNATITTQEDAQKEAGKLRQEQRELYQNGKKDRELSLKVLSQATKVLEKFYQSQPALLQKGGQAPQVVESERHTGESNVVLAMLAKIMDDIRLEEKHAAASEEKESAAYDAYELDCRHNFDSIMMEITEKVTRRAKLEVKRESFTEDNEAASTALGAITTKLEATKSECDPLIAKHEERTKARRFEIDQLKDAREILSGSQIAARTAFLASERSFLQQKTSDAVLQQLQGVSRTVGQLIATA